MNRGEGAIAGAQLSGIPSRYRFVGWEAVALGGALRYLKSHFVGLFLGMFITDYIANSRNIDYSVNYGTGWSSYVLLLLVSLLYGLTEIPKEYVARISRTLASFYLILKIFTPVVRLIFSPGKSYSEEIDIALRKSSPGFYIRAWLWRMAAKYGTQILIDSIFFLVLVYSLRILPDEFHISVTSFWNTLPLIVGLILLRLLLSLVGLNTSDRLDTSGLPLNDYIEFFDDVWGGL